MFLQKLLLYLSTAGLLCYMATLYITLNVLHLFFPNFVKRVILKIGERTTMTQNQSFKYEDWGLTLLSTTFVKTALKNSWTSLRQEAFVGKPAPDTPVVTMDGEKTSLLKFLRRELVLLTPF